MEVPKNQGLSCVPFIQIPQLRASSEQVPSWITDAIRAMVGNYVGIMYDCRVRGVWSMSRADPGQEQRWAAVVDCAGGPALGSMAMASGSFFS